MAQVILGTRRHCVGIRIAMTAHAADDFTSIAAARVRILKEEGCADPDVGTATGGDLDAVAAGVGLARPGYEAYDVLRQRVRALLEVRR